MTKYVEGDTTQKVSHAILAEKVFVVHPRTLARWMSGDINVPYTADIPDQEYTIRKVSSQLKISDDILLNVLRGKDSLVEIDEAAMMVGTSRTALLRNEHWHPARVFASSRRAYYSNKLLQDAHRLAKLAKASRKRAA